MQIYLFFLIKTGGGVTLFNYTVDVFRFYLALLC